MISKGLWLSVAIVLALVAIAFRWKPYEPVEPLTVAVGLWPGSETLIMARESGELEGAGINLVEMTWASSSMRAFENGVVDAAVLTLDETLLLQQHGHPVRIMLVMDFSEGADALVVGTSSIGTIAGLKGRSVGVETRTVGAYLLARALAEAGMRMNDVRTVAINLAETEGAFDARELDAVVTSEPYLTRLSRKGIRRLAESRGERDAVVRVLAVRTEAILSHRQALQKLIDAHFQSLQRLRSSKWTPVHEIIGRREGLDEREFRAVLERLRSPDRRENQRLLSEGGEGLTPMLQRLRQFLQEAGLLGRTTHDLPVLDASMIGGGA